MGPRWVLRQQLLEKHERPVYGIAFNDAAQDLQHLVATAGGRQISVYSLDTAASGLSLLFGYACPDQLEELYVVKWMLLSDGSLVLAAAGACGHVHVVETIAKDGAAAHTQKCVLLGHGERIVRPFLRSFDLSMLADGCRVTCFHAVNALAFFLYPGSRSDMQV